MAFSCILVLADLPYIHKSISSKIHVYQGVKVTDMSDHYPVFDTCYSLRWRHNGRDGVSNHQPHVCYLNRLFKAQIKEHIKAPRHWPSCGKFVGDQWIPRTNGQYRGKRFHLMTSSCTLIMKWLFEFYKRFKILMPLTLYYNIFKEMCLKALPLFTTKILVQKWTAMDFWMSENLDKTKKKLYINCINAERHLVRLSITLTETVYMDVIKQR